MGRLVRVRLCTSCRWAVAGVLNILRVEVEDVEGSAREKILKVAQEALRLRLQCLVYSRSNMEFEFGRSRLCQRCVRILVRGQAGIGTWIYSEEHRPPEAYSATNQAQNIGPVCNPSQSWHRSSYLQFVRFKSSCVQT